MEATEYVPCHMPKVQDQFFMFIATIIQCVEHSQEPGMEMPLESELNKQPRGTHFKSCLLGRVEISPCIISTPSTNFLHLWTIVSLIWCFFLKKNTITQQKTTTRTKYKLNTENTKKAINTWAIPAIRYPAGTADWTEAELVTLERKTRKIMPINHALQPCSALQ